jgi:hypothetical protein
MSKKYCRKNYNDKKITETRDADDDDNDNNKYDDDDDETKISHKLTK